MELSTSQAQKASILYLRFQAENHAFVALNVSVSEGFNFIQDSNTKIVHLELWMLSGSEGFNFNAESSMWSSGRLMTSQAQKASILYQRSQSQNHAFVALNVSVSEGFNFIQDLNTKIVHLELWMLSGSERFNFNKESSMWSSGRLRLRKRQFYIKDSN